MTDQSSEQRNAPATSDRADTLAGSLELNKETLLDLDPDPMRAGAVKGGRAPTGQAVSEGCPPQTATAGTTTAITVF